MEAEAEATSATLLELLARGSTAKRNDALVAEAETRDELSREKLWYVRPGDIITPLKRASYFDNKDEDQGERFPFDADDDAYDWDEAEDDGIAPRVVRDVKTPTAQEME